LFLKGENVNEQGAMIRDKKAGKRKLKAYPFGGWRVFYEVV
jgi:hypothetical protein